MNIFRNTIFAKFASAVTFLISIVVLFFFYSRGFIPHDEGWIINPAQRISQGEIPYRDFHYIYTPAVAYLIGLGFKLFGASILLSRLITMAVSLLTIYILMLLTQSITKKKYAYLIPTTIYIVWLPIHINFAWPIVYSILSGLATCLLLLIFRRKRLFYLIFLAGITTGLTILFKQNIGFALLLNNVIFFLFEQKLRKKIYIFLYLFGVTFLPIILCIYFYFNHALIPFINDMYFFIIKEFILKGLQSTPFIYPDIWYKEAVKALLYLFPLLISITSAIFTFKKNKSFVFLATFSGFYYLLGIRPTTDFMHLVPLLSITGIPLLLVLFYANNRFVKIACSLIFISSIMLGLYSALFMNYYRWDTPIIHQNLYTSSPRLGVLTDAKYHEIIPTIDDYIESHTTQKSYLFIYSFSPSFYLLTDRKNPTKFIYLPISLLSNNDQKEIIQNLTNKNVPIVLTDIDIKDEKSKIADYIKSNYKEVKKISNYTIWQKKLNGK